MSTGKFLTKSNICTILKTEHTFEVPMLIVENLPLEEKLKILSEGAKYDVACTSSGVERRGKGGTLGSTSACGICHSFGADGRCISLLKVLLTNECIYDCKYCLNRRANDTLRTAFTPEELCSLTMEFYRRNYIEGLFLSSGIRKSPDDTMEQMCRVLYLLRVKERFNGYIHVKAIPGASTEWIEVAGRLADRMSVNLELATSEGLKKLAAHKTRKTILTPMRQIQQGISAAFLEKKDTAPGKLAEKNRGMAPAQRPLGAVGFPRTGRHLFVPAGQSTQLIVGATKENDYQILSVSEALYKNYSLKRVFYSAYIAMNDDSSLPAVGTPPPLLREHRLYQADWLLRYYGFQAGELLSEERPNFNVLIDPKCDWALGHLEQFPVEINQAPYGKLLRVPGIGVKSAKRIMAARRQSTLDFPDLKRMGVVLKRAQYFITCKGKMLYPVKIQEDYLLRRLLDEDKKKNWEIAHDVTYRQLSLFDDMKMEQPVW